MRWIKQNIQIILSPGKKSIKIRVKEPYFLLGPFHSSLAGDILLNIVVILIPSPETRSRRRKGGPGGHWLLPKLQTVPTHIRAFSATTTPRQRGIDRGNPRSQQTLGLPAAPANPTLLRRQTSPIRGVTNPPTKPTLPLPTPTHRPTRHSRLPPPCVRPPRPSSSSVLGGEEDDDASNF